MKRIACDLFGTGEHIYFNIMRLAELERAIGRPLLQAMQGGFSISELLEAYVIGLHHEKRRPQKWYADRIQELMDDGTVTSYDEVLIPVVKAIIGSGFLGKKAYYEAFPEEVTEKAKEEIATEEAKAKN